MSTPHTGPPFTSEPSSYIGSNPVTESGSRPDTLRRTWTRGSGFTTTSSTSSSSTTWGPGTLTAKALTRLGTAMIDGAMDLSNYTWLKVYGNGKRLDSLTDVEFQTQCKDLVECARAHWSVTIRTSALRLVGLVLRSANYSPDTQLWRLRCLIEHGLFADLHKNLPTNIFSELKQTVMTVLDRQLHRPECPGFLALLLESWVAHFWNMNNPPSENDAPRILDIVHGLDFTPQHSNPWVAQFQFLNLLIRHMPHAQSQTLAQACLLALHHDVALIFQNSQPNGFPFSDVVSEVFSYLEATTSALIQSAQHTTVIDSTISIIEILCSCKGLPSSLHNFIRRVFLMIVALCVTPESHIALRKHASRAIHIVSDGINGYSRLMNLVPTLITSGTITSTAFATYYADNKPTLNQNDMVILIMGGTGVGKSGFIKTVTFGNAGVGDGLDPETVEMRAYSNALLNQAGRNIVLVDTPGLNTTLETGANASLNILVWLAATYREGIRITGIIYLHRASDGYIDVDGKAAVRMFRNLCGPEALSNVVLVMTHADLVGQESMERRRRHEPRTDPDFWQSWVAQGTQVAQYGNNLESGLAIIDLFRSKKPTSLLVQQELVDYKKAPGESTAGKSIYAELKHAIKGHEVVLEALRNNVVLADRLKDWELLEQTRREIESRENLKKDAEQQRKTLTSRHTRKFGSTIEKILPFA